LIHSLILLRAYAGTVFVACVAFPLRVARDTLAVVDGRPVMRDDVSASEAALVDWARRYAAWEQAREALIVERDRLVCEALAAKSNIYRLFALTGIARSTLYRIAGRSGESL
jgi:hypothetical protein